MFGSDKIMMQQKEVKIVEPSNSLAFGQKLKELRGD